MPTVEGSAPLQPTKPKFGILVARIGAMFDHRLERDIQLESGRMLKRGGKVHLSVERLTDLNEDELKHVRWMCRHPSCAIDDETGGPRRWPNKRALLIDHNPRATEFKANEEAHVLIAVGWFPAYPAVAEQRDKKTGELLVAPEDAKPARVALFSDEE